MSTATRDTAKILKHRFRNQATLVYKSCNIDYCMGHNIDYCMGHISQPLLAQSLFLKVEINPLKSDYSLEGLKLKLQHFGHLMPRVYSLEKTLMLGKTEGKIGGDRGWDGWTASWNQWKFVWTNSRRWWRTGKPDKLQSLGSQRVGDHFATEQQGDLEMINRVRHVT